MLDQALIAGDINELCSLIDKSASGETLFKSDGDNFAINESLAYVLHSFMPVISKQTNE